MPISPAKTPRRAVVGELSHFNERMKSAVAIRYVISMTCSVGTLSRFPWPASLEHAQHAVGDKEPANDVACGRNDRNRAENFGQLRPVLVVFAGQNDRADNCDRVQRIRQRHQRRMKQWRNAPDHFKSNERGQHKNVEAGQQVQLHDFATSFEAPGKAGSKKNSRTRALTTSPSLVSNVSRTISSSRFNCSLPSLTKCRRNADRFRAYIWLA